MGYAGTGLGWEIPVIRFVGGRKMFIDVQDVEQFIEKNKRTIK